MRQNMKTLKNMIPHRRCVYWSLVLGLLGVTTVAWAQDPTVPVPAEILPAVELLRAGGLPAVLLYLGWVIGKGLPSLQIHVTVDKETKEILRQIAEKIE